MRHKEKISHLPAAPGWHVCWPLSNDLNHVDDIGCDPIIGWLVVTDRTEPIEANPTTLTPITLESVLPPIFCIKRPDGVFVFPDDAEYKTEAEAIEHFNGKAGAKP